jgi:molybdenum cofactor cytidylyltransferase
MSRNRTGVIILAAGNSSRLGRPKQLLPYRGQTLLAHVAGEALAADLKQVVVVTGAFHPEVSNSLSEFSIAIVFNPAWETGMASGIVAGLSKMQPDLDAVIIAVCDQPFISSALLLQLIDTHETSEKGIIACTYADSMGTPVLFARKYFDQLSKLSGAQGAKKLLKNYAADLATVDFPNGNVDIDTAEDVGYLEI